MRRAIGATIMVLATMATAAEPAKPAPAPGKQGAKPTPEQLQLKKAKQSFMAAAGACGRPEECDPGSRAANRDLVDLFKGAQANFMTACEACAQREACEAEAQRIGDGKTSLGFAPCK